MLKRFCCALWLCALINAVQAQDAAGRPACDRACLENYVDRYIDAMLAHNPGTGLFAPEIRFTENGVRLPFGREGLWLTMSGKGGYKFYVPDVETQQIAFIGTAREGLAPRAAAEQPAEGNLVAIALRLKIVNNLITEAEQLVIRPETSLFGDGGNSGPPPRFPPTGEAVEKLGAPHPIYAEVIPEAERASREDLVKVGNYYFAGLQRNDGKGYYPFTDDCLRLENGIQAAGPPPREPAAAGQNRIMGCKEQFEKGLKGVVSRIRDRRFVAVDRERGIAFAFGFFDHERINWTWQIAELFKIEKGEIRRIEAVFHRCPYGMNSGWSTYEQGMSEEIQSVR